VVDVGDDAKIARVFYSHEKAGIISQSEQRVNLKLHLRRKLKGLFDWPCSGSLGYSMQICQIAIPHKDPMKPCQSSE
jgi:hypothetical protein